MFEVLLIVLPIFIVLATGNILYRLKFFDQHFMNVSNKLIFYFLLPVLLFYKIANSNIKSFSLSYLLIIMASTIFIMFFISFITGNLFGFKKSSIGTFAMNSFRANYAYMGLPVCYYAFGDKGLTIASILMAFIVPVVNLMSVISLIMTSDKKMSLKNFIKNTLFNPLAIACISGIFFSLLSIKIPNFLNKSLELMSNVTLPLALFSIGATLDFKKVKGSFKIIFLNVIYKLFLLPLIALVLLKITSPSTTFSSNILVIMLSSPAATVNYILASEMGGDKDLASSVIILSSAFSILSFVFWITILS
ncbi:MAG: malate permease [Deferribacteres bacterium]|jgi:predicted permease|nr:malate permease [Deferribacteres bacterium]